MMGCAFGKASALEDGQESPKGRQVNKGASVVSRGNSGKREESFRVKNWMENGDVKISYLDKKTNSSRRVRDEQLDKEMVKSEVVDSYPVIRSLPNATEREQLAAGWPSWLAGVAGESIKGWIPRRADTFEKLDKASAH